MSNNTPRSDMSERYQALLNTSGEGIIVISIAGIIQSFSRAAEEMFGYAEKDVVGQDVRMLMLDQHWERHDWFLNRYRITPPEPIKGRRSVTAQAVRKDKTTFPINLAVADFSDNGETFIFGIVQDLTERHSHEQELNQWNDNLEEELQRRGRVIDQIFSLSNEIFTVVGYDGIYQALSPSFERVTGFRPDQAVGHHYRNFVHPEDLERSAEIIVRLRSGERIEEFQNRHLHSDGSYRWLRWTITPTDDQMFCLSRDITEEKLREEAARQSQKMEAVGQLTGGIAHDFNNLLMAITGSLDLMDRKLPVDRHPSINRYMDGAQSSAKKAAALTHRLLAFSRRQALAPAVIDVDALVQGMHDLIERTIGSEIQVVMSPSDGVWPVLCDAHQLESGLLNLFLNSRDAMPEGGTITVRTMNITAEQCLSRGIPSGEYVKIAVRDTGHGMDEATKAKAFDPFFTTKPVGSGTGLGLSMVYGFVHQTGGHLRIESEPGKGAAIMLYLPRTMEAPVVESVAAAPRTKPKIGASVLIVEDEDVIRALFGDVLSGAGYSVSCAAEANAALKLIGDPLVEIDLLVTDVGLPGISGKQLADLARKIRPDLPILFITGYAAGITLREDLVMDNADMLLKPISMDALQAKVSEMLRDD